MNYVTLTTQINKKAVSNQFLDLGDEIVALSLFMCSYLFILFYLYLYLFFYFSVSGSKTAFSRWLFI